VGARGRIDPVPRHDPARVHRREHVGPVHLAGARAARRGHRVLIHARHDCRLRLAAIRAALRRYAPAERSCSASAGRSERRCSPWCWQRASGHAPSLGRAGRRLRHAFWWSLVWQCSRYPLSGAAPRREPTARLSREAASAEAAVEPSVRRTCSPDRDVPLDIVLSKSFQRKTTKSPGGPCYSRLRFVGGSVVRTRLLWSAQTKMETSSRIATRTGLRPAARAWPEGPHFFA